MPLIIVREQQTDLRTQLKIRSNKNKPKILSQEYNNHREAFKNINGRGKA